MKRSMKRFLTLLAAAGVILGLSLPANAGKGGSGSGMSGGGMSRSMGSHRSGMSARSMQSSGMSVRNFSAPARGMARPSHGHGNVMQSAARQLNSSVSRSRGESSSRGIDRVTVGRSGMRNPSKGGAFDRVTAGGHSRGRGAVGLSDLVKGRESDSSRSRRESGSFDAGRITKVLGDRLGAKHSPIANRTGIADRLKTGRISPRDVAKIDRSKLRELVKGIESGKSGRHPLNPRGLVDNSPLLKGANKTFLAGGHGPHHKNHHHSDHWLGFHFGSFWFDHGHDDYCHDDYDYCRQPYYAYPPCGVTFAAYPEVVTIAATQPVVIDQEINLEFLLDEPEVDKADGGEAIEDELTTDDRADALAAERATESPSRDLGAQPEFDLELVDVEMIAAGDQDSNQGPRYEVTVRNAGKRDLEKFLVSLVACKADQIDSSSLHASTTVEQLAAGEETTLVVTLSVEALSLNRDRQGRTWPFNTLIAAVDSDERVNEGNEENNLALIDRVSMKLASN